MCEHPQQAIMTRRVRTPLPAKQQQKQQPQQQQRKRRTRVVSFKPTVVVHKKGLHLNDYTDEEIASSWYTSEEQEEMRKDIQRAVALLNKRQLRTGTATGTTTKREERMVQYCSRGLESRTRLGAREKFGRRQVTRKAVLDAQDVYQGAVDKEARIAQVYSQHTKQATRAAYVRGLQDEADALPLSMCGCGKGRSYVTSDATILWTMRSYQHGQRSGQRSHQIYSLAA